MEKCKDCGGRMQLAKTELGRAEQMSKEEREKYELPEKGLVITETWFCDCK